MSKTKKKKFADGAYYYLGVAMHELSSTSDKQEDNQEIRNVFFSTFILPVSLTAPYKIKTMQKKQHR